jgi:hypothetical protein
MNLSHKSHVDEPNSRTYLYLSFSICNGVVIATKHVSSLTCKRNIVINSSFEFKTFYSTEYIV